MRKTLLNALKHGSGTIFILLSMMLGGSMQAWGETRSFSAGEKIYFVNFKPSGWNDTWIKSGGYAKIELWKEDDSTVTYNFEYVNGGENAERACYAATISDANTFKKYKIYRCPNSGSCWNETKDISFGDADAGKNTIVECSSGSSSVTWVASRSFSAGDYIYLRNIKPESNWSEFWVDTNTRYAYLYMFGGTAGTHTYKFNFVEGTEYDADAIYGAQVLTEGSYACFILTRGDASCADGSFPGSVADQTKNVPFDATKNYIYEYNKNVTSVTWDVYCNVPTVTTGSSSYVTSTGSTLAATVSLAATTPCEPIYVGVKVYSDAECSSLVTSSQTEYVENQSGYSLSVTGLTPETTYYYKAYAISAKGTILAGTSGYFTTLCMTLTLTGLSNADEKYCTGAIVAPLSVVITDGAIDPTYQWYYSATKAEPKSGTLIVGATSASYTPTSGDYYYYCMADATGSCANVTSAYSGKVVFDTTQSSPVISVSTTNTTNYAPVTLTTSGTVTWSAYPTTGGYFYKETVTGAMFKATVGDGSAVTYTITGTAGDCSSSVAVTVNSDADSCR